MTACGFTTGKISFEESMAHSEQRKNQQNLQQWSITSMIEDWIKPEQSDYKVNKKQEREAEEFNGKDKRRHVYGKVLSEYYKASNK